MIGYVTEVWWDGAGGWLQQEGDFPIVYGQAGPDTGRFEFNATGFAVGDRVLFDVDGGSAINLRR